MTPTLPMYPAMYPAAQALSDPTLVDWLAIAADAGIVVLCLVAAAALIWALLIMREIRRAASQLTGVVRKLSGKVDPVIQRSTAIAKNVEYVSENVRSEVERMTGSVQALSERLQQASDRMEERIEDFNALMEVVQGEAESTFIDTASTVRGVRAGARNLTGVDGDGGGPGTRLRLPDEGREP